MNSQQVLFAVVGGHPGGSWYGEFMGMDRHDNGQPMYRVGCGDGSFNLVSENEVMCIVQACAVCGKLPTKRDGLTISMDGRCEGRDIPVS